MADLIILALKSEAPNLFTKYNNVHAVGVGKLNAAINTMRLINEHKPDRVFNFGTVGLINETLSGFIEINRVCQRDMNAEPKSPRGITPFEDSTIYISNAAPGVGYRCGTGDSFVSAEDTWHTSYCDVVDMEGYAIAFACKVANVPWFMYKYITDFANAAGFESWQENVAKGEACYAKVISQMINIE